MFDNIGNKIKTLAKILVYLGSIISIIVGLAIIFNEDILIGVIYLIVGPILSWISSFTLYGFGQLIENSDIIANNTSKEKYPIHDDSIIDKKTSDKKEGRFLYQNNHNANNKFSFNIKQNDYNERCENAKHIIKHLSQKELQDLTHKYTNWYESIKRLSLNNLLDIIDKEQDACEKEYVYLCCYEILKKIKDNDQYLTQ